MTKRAWIIAGIALVAAAISIVIAVSLYGQSRDEAPAPLSSLGAGGTSGDFDPAGTWTAGVGSQAGYRVEEVLNGQDVTVVGRTNQVTATVIADDTEITSAEITVDVGSIATDSSARDEYFKNVAMRVTQYPEATFVFDTPIPAPDLTQGQAEVDATGTLSLAGASKSVSLNMTIQRDGDNLIVAGSAPITFKDFSITAPNLGFVKVEPQGLIEFRIILAR